MHRRLAAVGIIVLAMVGFGILKATRPPPPPVEVRERIWRVAAQPVQPVSARPTLTLYGRIEAPDRVRAAAPVSARVLEVRVRDGEPVAAGTVLLRLDPRDLQPRLAQARADLERERVRQRADRLAIEQERTLLTLAEAKVARFERLKNKGFSAESAWDQAREELARARLALAQREQAIREHPVRLAQLQAKLAEAERDAERGEIRAAFDARIGAVQVAAGDQVQAGAALLTLYPADALFLRARVPAIYAEELRRALAAGETLGATAEFGGSRLPARLERIAGEADARGVEVLLRLDEAATVPVGAFVNAVLERPLVHGVLSLPWAALHGGERIYQVRDGRLVGVRVHRVGERRDGEQVWALVRAEGLVPEAPVMITHLPNALDGLAVEVVEGRAEMRVAP